MVHLRDYFSPANMVQIQSNKLNDAIRELLCSALKSGGITPDKKTCKKLLREKALSRGITLTPGILLCHTRTDLVSEIQFKAAFCPEDPHFSKDAVELLMVILLPSHASQMYLSLLARMSRFLNTAEFEEARQKKDEDLLISAVASFDEDLI
ncbi:MAG: PTS sugar transporter subunit IIA [Fibrobacterota bacterium]